MLGMETVAECMADNVVGHHPVIPRFRKTVQALAATRRLEDSMHPPMMTNLRTHARRSAVTLSAVAQCA